jgi:hypothetical protein
VGTVKPREQGITLQSFDSGDFLLIETFDARVTLNPPRSRLARRIWRFFGFEWTDKAAGR